MSQKDIKINTEYLDVLDEYGKPLGIKKPKEDVHRDGDWHGTVQIWLMNPKGEVLMQKRSALKTSRPNKWDNSCAGHMSAGESAINTALRELKEELNLEAQENDLELLYVMKTEQIEQNGKFINHQHNNVYLAKIDLDIDSLKLQEEEVAEVKFIHHEELEQHFRHETMDFEFHPDFYKNEINILFKEIKRIIS